MFEGPSMRNFLIDGVDAMDRYVGHHVHRIWPLNFFLWGYAKDRVFTTPVNDIGELQTRIRGVIATITGEMLTRIFQEFEYKKDIVRATNWAHVEVY